MQRKTLFKILLVTCLAFLTILALFLIPVLAFVFIGPFLKSEYPVLAVASGSMVPALNVGDLVTVQGGLKIDEISARYVTGDIIVFYRPSGRTDLIIHRAVEVDVDQNNVTFLKTKGDHNPSTDYWKVYESDIVGKVVGVVPYLGNIPLLIHRPEGLLLYWILALGACGLVVATIVVYVVQKREIAAQTLAESAEVNRVEPSPPKQQKIEETAEASPEIKPSPQPVGVYCRYCGATNKGDAVFCQACGKNIRE